MRQSLSYHSQEVLCPRPLQKKFRHRSLKSRRRPDKSAHLSHVMQMSLYSKSLNHAEVAQWRKPIPMSMKMTLHSENLNHAEVARWRKPISIPIQMPLYSENLNYAEVAQWRKPISMLYKYRFTAKT